MSNGFDELPAGLPADALDGVLVSALRGRKVRGAGIDVAAGALARVRAWEVQERNLARLARLNRWMRVATFGAAALIAVVVGVGYKYWPAAVEADSATDSGTTLVSSLDWTTLGIGVFGVTLVAVVLAMLFTADRPQMRVVAG